MRAWLAIGLLWLASCRGEAAPAHGDWELDDEPVLVVGGVAGDSARDLSRVAGAIRFNDGSLVIANGSTSELRWFAPSGALLAITRRSDSFPGVSSLFRRGDTVFVWDVRSRMLGQWDAARRYHGSRHVGLGDSTRSIGLRGLLDDGALLVESPGALVVPDSGQVMRNPATLFRMPPAGPAESLGTVVGDEFFVAREGNRASMLRLPFGVATRIITGPWGYAVNEDASGRVTVYAADGRSTKSIIVPSRLPVMAADRDRLRRVVLGSTRSGREAEAMTRLWDMMPFPDSFPGVTGLVGDPGALGWAREAAHLADSSATWRVLGVDGAELAHIRLPALATPFDIGKDYVVLHVLDTDGIERVQVHRLRRGDVS